MTIVFKPFFEHLEKRLRNAAYDAAKAYVAKLKEITFSRSLGHWSDEGNKSIERNGFWLQAESAHMNAILNSARNDIENYAVAKIKEVAASLEQYASENKPK